MRLYGDGWLTKATPMQDSGSGPLVDVLLPVYNGAATIAESIESLLQQTVSRLRILVVDDGSKDATAEILADLSRRDPRVVVITQPNGGIVEALNHGLSHVTAPFVARQDADDISFPDRIQRQLEAFEAEPSLVAVSGSCIHIDTDGRETGSHYTVPDTDAADDHSLPANEPYLLHPFLMVRSEAFTAVHGYRYVFHSEDTDLYWRLREVGRLKNFPTALGKMRLHAGSISNASLQNGRIMAVQSQLAAISARRRADGREDLAFPRTALAEYRTAPDLQAMIGIAGRSLNDAERDYLRKATAVKLLELASGRMYEIDDVDCAFIREVYTSLSPAQIGSRSVANWAYRATVTRLLNQRRFSELKALLDFGVLGHALRLRLADIGRGTPEKSA